MNVLDTDYVMSAVEALLFVSDEPVAAAKLAEIIQVEKSKVVQALRQLKEERAQANAGVQVREVAGGWQLVTHPEHHDLIEGYVASWDTRRLSAAAMETLAIIAYMQPVTRAQVSSVRGVTSDSSISSLVEKGLVKEAGCADTPGNPLLYATTRTFLDKFGLKDLADLEDLATFAPDEETERLIRQRLSASRDEIGLSDEEAARMAEQMLFDADAEDAVAGMVAHVQEEAQEVARDELAQGPDADPLREMMYEALASTAGVVEKIDLSSLTFDTEDE